MRAGKAGWTLVPILVALLGCSADPGPGREPRTSYVPPVSAPPLEPTVLRRGQPGRLLAAIADGLRQRGYTVAQVDRDRGIVVATAAIPPDLVLDCGWIVDRSRNGAGPVPAASPELALVRGSEDETITRRLEATVRVVVRAEPLDAERTLLSSRAYYVVIRSAGGSAAGRELVHFETGGYGTFARGTRCQSNGRVEREALVAG